MDRHFGRLTGRVPELCPHGNLNHLYGAFLSGFLWPIIMICLVCSPYLVYLRILVYVCISYPRWILLKRLLGRTSLDLTPVWFPRSLFCTCVVGEVWLREWEICVFCRVQPPPLIAVYSYLGVSINREWISSCFTLAGPICLLPQDHVWGIVLVRKVYGRRHWDTLFWLFRFDHHTFSCSPQTCDLESPSTLDGPKNLFFCNILWKNPNELIVFF